MISARQTPVPHSLHDHPAIRNPRAHALADRLEQGADALLAYADMLSDAEWQMPLPHDGRRIGLVVHHVASMYPIEIEIAQTVAAGRSIRGLTARDIDAMNAAHAQHHPDVGRQSTLELLRRNATAAGDAIRGMTDTELDRAAEISLYGDAPLTCQFVLEDHAVRHAYHHLEKIRAALGGR